MGRDSTGLDIVATLKRALAETIRNTRVEAG
jgi:hypothetical protein